MKILWLSHLVPYPPKGGVLQRSYNLLHEVSKYHQIDLLAFNQPNLMRPLVSDIEEGLREAKRVLNGFCGKVEFIPIDSDEQFLGKIRLALKSLVVRDPYTINWLKSGLYAKALEEMLSQENYDLVHLDTISLVPFFKHIKNIPTVLDHHNIESHMLIRRAENENNFLKAWYFKQEGRRLEKVEKKYCPQFALNITCSELDQQRLQEIAPSSWVEEVPNGVDINFFKPDDSVVYEQNIVFVGRLSWYPNQEAVRFIAHKLWPALKAAVPDVTADIIGSSPPKDVAQVGMDNKDFRVHGFVDDIHPFFNKAAVYVCPIIDGGGTKLKVLDALAMGKALVANKVACEGIHVKNNETVMFAESVDDYVAAIQKLLDDADMRSRMGANARQLIEEKYSYEMVGENLCRLYEKCISK